MSNLEFDLVVHQTVATSKEMAEKLQELVAHYPTSTEPITLGLVETQAIASQLRITANLIEGLLQENTTHLTRIAELVNRVHKPE